MNNLFVSIIVPVYKVERYLPRCIESILGQTYTNFELILVDDGTPDRSGIICDRYAEKDSRIRVIHKENGGVSTARNAGIDAARGEWITFVDSDDWISSDYLEVLLTPMSSNDYDLTVGKLEYRAMVISSHSGQEKAIDTEKTSEEKDTDFLNRIEFLGTFYKLFSKKIIDQNQLRFSHGIAVGEDAIFVIKYLKYCKKIYMTDKVIYFYNCLNNSSVTKRAPYFEDRKLWDVEYIENYASALEAFGVHEELLDKAVLKKALFGYIAVSRSIIHNFDERGAKDKLVLLFDFYDKWFRKRNGDHIELGNEWYNKVAIAILEKDEDLVYSLMQEKKKNTFLGRVKCLIKKIAVPVLERYRDGVKKCNI